jgi:putative transposase
MYTPAPALALSEGQKADIEALVRNGNTPQKVALRARLLLLAHQGVANHAIAQELNLSRPTVVSLRACFAREGMNAVTGIRKRKRSGTVLTPELEQKILDTTLKTRPGDGSTHWSVRMLAKQLGISRTIVPPGLAAPRCAAASGGALQTFQRSPL